MLSLSWTTTVITTNKQANDMVVLFKKLKPTIGAFDTETTGLHIIYDKPFLFQFGFAVPEQEVGYAYAVDIETYPDLANQVIRYWHKHLAPQLDVYMGHNVKFDLHMLINNGTPYTGTNLTDTMFYIRHAHDALTPANGGPPLGLKPYAAQYIDRNARFHERQLDYEKTCIVKDLNIKLKNRLHIPIKAINELFKDVTMTYEDLPKELKERYLDWLYNDVPIWLQNKVNGQITADMIPYNKLNRSKVLMYSMYDIVYTIEIYLKTKPVVEARGNMVGVEFENRIIPALIEMERVGYKVNKPYLLDCQHKMKKYIHKRRQDLYNLAGTQMTVGQHALVKNILAEKYNLQVASTGSEQLELIKDELIRSNTNPKAVEFIECIEELRTLEKWYATYIMRFVNELKRGDRIYTTINQVGTVSGRVTSDFQQFPKKGIVDKNGNELFSPRRMVEVTGDGYDAIVYLDYSQIELRFQALYTILVGHPDMNLCRAYMPYECWDKDGHKFDCHNPDDIKAWNKGWYLDKECTQIWVATDVHGATTKAAFDIDESDPNFHDLRYIGKRVNFAKNYGAQRGKIRQMFPHYSEEQITKIDEAYYKAFPGVKEYHTYCYKMANLHSYVQNLFGIKYYGVTGHKLINMLIQGSAAYYLKMKIYQIWKYAKEHNHKTRWQMQIHDELSWEWNTQDSPEIFFEYQHIMQDWDDTLVPLVADMEVTTTNWKEKVEVESIEELQIQIHSSTRP